MAAAEYFIRMRMKGRYRDLIALEQFGNEAYVITPFTTDYENLLLSLKMISDVNEWQRFPDQGTIIMKAIDEGVDLFNAFDFLDSSGNIMVIFSDGQDNNVQIGTMSLDQVLKKAVDNKVPVYMIRTAYARGLFDVVPDQVWKKAIDATGGRFYPAASQETIMQAIKEIDAAATGRVEVREYAVKQPRYARFALAAVVLWTHRAGSADDVADVQDIPMKAIRWTDHRALVRVGCCVLSVGGPALTGGPASSAGWPSRRKIWRCSTSSTRRPNTPRSRRTSAATAGSRRDALKEIRPPDARCCSTGRATTPISSRWRAPPAEPKTRTRSIPRCRCWPPTRCIASRSAGRRIAPTLLKNLDAAIRAYAEALRAGAERPDVAFNYELAVRMRAGSGRRQAQGAVDRQNRRHGDRTQHAWRSGRAAEGHESGAVPDQDSDGPARDQAEPGTGRRHRGCREAAKTWVEPGDSND